MRPGNVVVVFRAVSCVACNGCGTRQQALRFPVGIVLEYIVPQHVTTNWVSSVWLACF